MARTTWSDTSGLGPGSEYFSKLPFAFAKGTDFSSGGKRDVSPFLKLAAEGELPDYSSIFQPTAAQQQIAFAQALEPFQTRSLIRQAQLASQLTQSNLAQVYPFLSAAAREKTQRELAASERFAGFKEGLPSAISARTTEQQARMQSAQAGEAELMRAVAAQQQAANAFGGSYRGQLVSFG